MVVTVVVVVGVVVADVVVVVVVVAVVGSGPYCCHGMPKQFPNCFLGSRRTSPGT